MRAVVDVNVLISALLSRRGAPARVVKEWVAGAFDLIVSPSLFEELSRALAHPRIRKHVTQEEAAAFVELLRQHSTLYDDPVAPPPVRSADPADDHLVALAIAARAVIVSGDRHLLDLGDELPVHSPADFLGLIQSNGP